MKKVGVILGAGILLAIVLEEYEADAHGVDTSNGPAAMANRSWAAP